MNAFRFVLFATLFLYHRNLHSQVVPKNCAKDTLCIAKLLKKQPIELLRETGLPFEGNPCPDRIYMLFTFSIGKIKITRILFNRCDGTKKETFIAEGNYSLSLGGDGNVYLHIKSLPSLHMLMYEYDTNGKIAKSNDSNSYEIRFKPKNNYEEIMTLTKGAEDDVPEIAEFIITN